MLRTLADARNPGSLSNRLRQRRFRLFDSLVESRPRPLRIVDLGGTPQFWVHRGWAGREDVEITTVNLTPEPSRHANIASRSGDATDLRDLPDHAFDVVFSNSVIEHLFTLERQAAMAREIRRLAPAFWVQTPNYWFPIEPHFHVPGWQWMPTGVRRAVIRRRRCGWRGPCPNPRDADAAVREVRLLTRRELERLFPGATIVAERFGGLAKSWMVHDGFNRGPEVDDA
ncbi:MAG: methyltransferase domain-containing protein [Phycisphaerales bacterium]|nr:methyltransferase domain-containing protein [Phycisphaerales bacterium]NNM26075.1 methyltransferase domain-containing protein [Phycisphaerales bacterium]